MKRMSLFISFLLTFSFLTGCTGPYTDPEPDAAASPDPVTGSVDEPEISPSESLTGPVDEAPWFATYRVVDDLNGTLVLAENGGGAGAVYTLPAEQCPEGVTEGMLINVYFEAILETYPARFGGVSRVELSDAPVDDRCGLYLQVLEDLWVVDPGLNSNLTELGLDLSGVTSLSEAEKSAVAYAFACAHDLFPAIEGTLAEIKDAGHLSQMVELDEGYEPSLAHYRWEKGCFFSIEEEVLVHSTPMYYELNGEQFPETLAFSAHKWRSGLGAYFFGDCTAQRQSDGRWTYTVGSEVIA